MATNHPKDLQTAQEKTSLRSQEQDTSTEQLRSVDDILAYYSEHRPDIISEIDS